VAGRATRRVVRGRSGHRRRGEHGSAIVDFALVSVVLVPLFFGILQLALIWHVKTTLTSAASEGARYGASYNREAEDGALRTSAVIDEVFGTDFDDLVSASTTQIAGAQAIVIEVRAEVPVLVLWGPTVQVDVTGHAIKEEPP
jgi:Flp pilus assembly protein TadG